MKKLLALTLALTMSLCLVACGGKTEAPVPGTSTPQTSTTGNKETKPIVISLSNAYSDMDQVNVELKAAAGRISERTNGVVDLKIYPNNTLGTPADAVEAIRSDAPLLYVTAFSQWEDYYPDACAIQAGFVFDSAEECVRFYDTDLFDEIVANLDAANIHCINCSFTAGMRHVLGKKQIKTPDDIKGLKLRVPGSSPYLDCFNSLGASPMAMPSSEQISALSAGTIDAVDQSISLIYSTKTYELVKECTLLAQMPLADGLYCSTTFWNSLPEEYRNIIEEELHTAGQNYYEYSMKNEATMRAEMEKAGVHFYDVDRAPFAVLAQENVLKYGIGQKVLDTVSQIRADIAAGK